MPTIDLPDAIEQLKALRQRANRLRSELDRVEAHDRAIAHAIYTAVAKAHPERMRAVNIRGSRVDCVGGDLWSSRCEFFVGTEGWYADNGYSKYGKPETTAEAKLVGRIPAWESPDVFPVDMPEPG